MCLHINQLRLLLAYCVVVKIVHSIYKKMKYMYKKVLEMKYFFFYNIRKRLAIVNVKYFINILMYKGKDIMRIH